MMLALLMVQLVGIPFAFAFGLLAGRIGAKRAILVALAVYAGITLYGFTLRTTVQFFVLAFLVATVQGGAQALSRSLFATLIPKHKAGEMFGFFGVFDRFGGAIGSFIFGLILAATGTSRHGILALITFFLLGAFLLSSAAGATPRRRTSGCAPSPAEQGRPRAMREALTAPRSRGQEGKAWSRGGRTERASRAGETTAFGPFMGKIRPVS
jgi:MFS-type transporter involved in bile tolerance (Atg22 family)